MRAISAGYRSNPHFTGIVLRAGLLTLRRLRSLHSGRVLETCNLSRHSTGFAPCAWRKLRLLKPYPVFATSTSDCIGTFGNLLHSRFALPLAGTGCKRQPKVEASKLSRHRLFRAARVGQSHEQRASIRSSLQCFHFLPRMEACREDVSKTVGATYRESGTDSSFC